MNKDLIPFDYNGNPVRVLKDEKGEPWFVAKDVCGVLGLTWSGNRVRHVPEEWRGVTTDVTRHQNQHGAWIEQEVKVTTLSEPGLYFFINRSDSPGALPFQKWVNGEVLPQIRKTGGYIPTTPGMSDTDIMARAVLIAQRTIEEQGKQLQQQKPKVTAYNAFIEGKGAKSVAEVAQALYEKGYREVGRTRLFKLLRSWGWLTRGNRPQQEYLERGWFKTVLGITDSGYTYSQTMVTPKGVEAVFRSATR